ncbi:MAG: sigma-70 family RNA polymerase sigma factor [Acidobacteriales bacterium]|nr:sigma-70 family RNA polymerase sigma factor [Terriglobales bacterium]
MPLEQLTDEELISKYRTGEDVQARDPYLDQLFRRYFTRVARWCMRFTTDRENAADLAQEVLTKAYQNLPSFQAQSKFSTWLFVIARNHCLNALRSDARQATSLKADVDEDFISSIPDNSSDPYAAMEDQSKAAYVTEVLNRTLDDTEKAVFTLHFAEELPLDAITRLLNLENKSGAKAYIVSAKRKLARLLPSRNRESHPGLQERGK